MSNTILNVAMNGLLVGEWRKLTSGATEFQYAKKWLESVRSRLFHCHCPYLTKLIEAILFIISSIIFSLTTSRSVHAFNNVSKPQRNPHLIYFR